MQTGKDNKRNGWKWVIFVRSTNMYTTFLLYFRICACVHKSTTRVWRTLLYKCADDTAAIIRIRFGPTIITMHIQTIFCVKLKSIDQIVIDLWCMTNKINSRPSDLWSIRFFFFLAQLLLCVACMGPLNFGLPAYRPVHFFPDAMAIFRPRTCLVCSHAGRLAGSISFCMRQNSYYSHGDDGGQHNVAYELIQSPRHRQRNFICGSDFSPPHICSRPVQRKFESSYSQN